MKIVSSRYVLVIVTAIFILLRLPAFAQQTEEECVDRKTRILFLFDASQSMYGEWENDRKINKARAMLIDMLDSLNGLPNLELALRVYGDQYNVPPQVCTDTRLLVPFTEDNVSLVKEALLGVTARGTTPIAYALEQCVNDFPPASNCKNVVVLITDGKEECDGDPCEVSLRLQQNNIFLRPFVIGIGSDFSAYFECMGTYLDATSSVSYQNALQVVISRALDNTTTQVNLLDIYGNPNETDVTMSFYDHNTGQLRYNYMHTLTSRGLSDTIYLDPISSYDMVVHTIPPVYVDNITLTSGEHNIIAADAPQGTLRVVEELIEYAQISSNAEVIVKQHQSCNIINNQLLGEKEHYLVGLYDVEVLTTPPLFLEGIEVTQNHTTTVQIPTPGVLSLVRTRPTYCELFKEENGKLRLVYRFSKTAIETKQLLLLPGNYLLVSRPTQARRVAHTREKRFVVKENERIMIDPNYVQ